MKLRIIFTSIILLGSLSIFAQKYKDIFPQIISVDEDKSFEILNAYLQNNLDQANANLRVALIYVKRYKLVDILKEQEKALALAEQAKIKLLKASLVVTEKEVKKNGDYYLGLVGDGSLPNYSQLSELIKSERQAVDDFLLKTPPIYKQFTNSVEKYDNAVKTFADIVGTYTSLKELYLLYDEVLAEKLNRLQKSYDSTKIFFDNYLKLRNQYAVNAVKQSYAEHSIKVYRLDGLVTQINFLQANIKLWNYSTWVDSVNLVVDQNIKGLRSDLMVNENKLKSAVKDISATQNPESFVIVHADKALMFNLMKYDYKNAIVPLLAYQEFQQQFIKDQKRKIYFDTATIAIDRKLAFYNDLMYASLEGDSIIAEFDERFNPVQIKRHQKFVDDAFGGAEEMKAYMTNQHKINQEIFLEQVTRIKAGILSLTKTDSIGGIIRYKRTTIPLYVTDVPVEELPRGQIKTGYLLQSADESIYVAGLQVTDAKIQNREIALVKLSAKLKPIWVKNIDLELDSAGVDANHWLGSVKLTSEGIAFLVRSVALDSSKVVNTLFHLTDDGKIKFAKRLNTELFPRGLSFIESSNMFVITYFGDNLKMNPQDKSNLSVVAINGLGEDLWQYDYMYNGDYQQMINTPYSILLGGNYTVIKNRAGRTYTSSNGSNAYMISLSLDGNLQDIKCFVSETPYTINMIYKVNDNNINLLGNNGEHIIINSKLEDVYSSVTLR